MSLWRTSVFEKCRDTGVYGLIIPDLPYELSQRLKQQFSHYGVKIISLVAMTTDDKRIKDIVSHAEGFIYTVTMNATTGQNGAFHPELKRKIESIKSDSQCASCRGIWYKNTTTCCRYKRGCRWHRHW